MAEPSVKLQSVRVGNPGFRACCLFTSAGPIFTAESSLDHHYGAANDAVGIMYSCNGGFIDLAHLRDVCDLTRFYYNQLKGDRSKKDATFTSFRYGQLVGKNGKILKDVAANQLINVSGRLAYLESVVHEIESYWWIAGAGPWPGMHNSAFSPEDLVSNHLGAILGMRALKELEAGTHSSWDEAVTDLLGELLGLFDGQNATRARTLAAYAAVDGVWYSRAAPGWDFYWTTLRRRNFGQSGDFNTVVPWIVSAVTGCPAATPWPATVPRTTDASLDSHFRVVYVPPPWAPVMLKSKVGVEMPNAGLAGFVAIIRQDAGQLYGPNYDSPDP